MGNGLGLAVLIGAGAGLTILAVRPQTFDAVTDFANGGHFAAENRYYLSDHGVPQNEIEGILRGEDDLRGYFHIRDNARGVDVYGQMAAWIGQEFCLHPAVIDDNGTFSVVSDFKYCATDFKVISRPK